MKILKEKLSVVALVGSAGKITPYIPMSIILIFIPVMKNASAFMFCQLRLTMFCSSTDTMLLLGYFLNLGKDDS